MIKINSDFFAPLVEKAKVAKRRRTNHNFHEGFSDTLQRMLNVMNKNTYIQPHKHENPDKREAFIILKGKGVVIEFDDEGKINDYILLDPSIGNHGCEVAAKTWHTVICLEDSTVFYEVKDGPYDVSDDKNFANWAPEEGDEECMVYQKLLLEQINLEC